MLDPATRLRLLRLLLRAGGCLLVLAFLATILPVDLHAGLPLLWTFAEGPPLIVVGVLMGMLNR